MPGVCSLLLLLLSLSLSVSLVVLGSFFRFFCFLVGGGMVIGGKGTPALWKDHKNKMTFKSNKSLVMENKNKKQK